MNKYERYVRRANAIDLAAKLLLGASVITILVVYWRVSLWILAAIIALALVLLTIAGALALWPAALLFAVIGGFFGGGAGALAGAAVVGIIGGVAMLFRRY